MRTESRPTALATRSQYSTSVAQSGAIGYWVGQPHVRRGHTLAAVRAVARFGFTRLGLHRLEAACCPDNEASRRLLLTAGRTRARWLGKL